MQKDWGHAKDYVEAMWLMLQQTKPMTIDWNRKQHTVEEFLTVAFIM